MRSKLSYQKSKDINFIKLIYGAEAYCRLFEGGDFINIMEINNIVKSIKKVILKFRITNYIC